jgi:hypothetical protein
VSSTKKGFGTEAFWAYNRGTMSNERSLSVRGPQQQLALLAASAQPTDSRVLMTQVLYGESVSVTSAAPALANDTLLNDLLKSAAVYRLDPLRSPEQDFLSLTTAVLTNDLLPGLRRLKVAFQEVRGRLAQQLVAASAHDVDGEAVDQQFPDQTRATQDAFGRVNASFILVLSAAHSRLEQADNRNALLREFTSLLSIDPYIGRLAPLFESLEQATSASARKMAVKEFFEIFCDQVTQPSLYDEKISALVQTMLLRELRCMIATDAKAAPQERKLGPYLATLFEKRIRSELEIAITGNELPQPILKALRDSPTEATHLMQSALDYLLESSDDEGVNLTIPEAEAVACEVLLSAGCLFPEISERLKIAEKLEYIEDMNPCLVVHLCAALRFGTLDNGQEYPINPHFLIERALSAAPGLSGQNKRRVFDEILLPLSDDLLEIFCDDTERFKAVPIDIRDQIITNVFVREIVSSQESDSVLPAKIDAIHRILADELLPFNPARCDLHAPVYSWLIERAAAGKATTMDCQQVAEMLVAYPNLTEKLAVSPQTARTIRQMAGEHLLEFLSIYPHKVDHHRADLFVEQVLTLSPSVELDSEWLYGLVEHAIVQPLVEVLIEYNEALASKERADAQVLEAADRQKVYESDSQELARHNRWVDAIRATFETHVKYFEDVERLEEIESDIQKKQATIARLSKMTPKEVFETDSLGRLERAQESLSELLSQQKKILGIAYKLDLSKDGDLHDYSDRSASIGSLRKLEGATAEIAKKLRPENERAATAYFSHESQSEGATQIRAQLDPLVSRAIRMFGSPRLRDYPLDSFALPVDGPGARQGLIVKLQLHATIAKYREASPSNRAIVALEVEARSTIETAVRRFREYSDTLLMLEQIAHMNRTDSPLLRLWPEAESAEDTTVGYKLDAIPEHASLAEYLFQRLRIDLENPQMAWLDHEPGWHESFHAPLTQIFGNTLARTDVVSKAKARALKAVYCSALHWTRQHNAYIHQPASEEGKPPPQPSAVPPEALIEPWTQFLRVSHGRGSRFANGIGEVTDLVTCTAIAGMKSATPEEMKTRYVPLMNALRTAVSDISSTLTKHSALLQSLEKAVEARLCELKNDEDTQQGAAQTYIQEAMPALALQQGLGYNKIKEASRLALPAPKAPASTQTRLGYTQGRDTP